MPAWTNKLNISTEHRMYTAAVTSMVCTKCHALLKPKESPKVSHSV